MPENGNTANGNGQNGNGEQASSSSRVTRTSARG